MKMNDNHFSFPMIITRDPASEKPTRLVDRELLLTEVREYVRPLAVLPAKPVSTDGSKLPPFDPTESMYIQWVSDNRRRAVFGAAGLFPKVIRVVSADEANLIQFSRHPEYDTFIHMAQGAKLIVLDLVTTLRRDLARWYNQAAFASLAGVVVRRGGAIWIVGTDAPAQFRQTFSDVYRVLRRLGAREALVGQNDPGSEVGDDGGLHDGG